MSRRLKVAGFVVGAIAAGCAMVPGVAAAGDGLTFDGACTFPRLYGLNDKPAGFLTPTQATAHVSGPGTCSGSVNGTQVSKAPVSLAMDVGGLQTCLMSAEPLLGTATVDLGGGAALKLNASLNFAFNTFHVGVTGASGSASGDTTGDLIATGFGPPILEGGLGCPLGKTKHATFNPLTLTTSSPLVSLP